MWRDIDQRLKGITVHCRMKCGPDSAPHKGLNYSMVKYCKHCSAVMPIELLNCYCCSHKLRTRGKKRKKNQSSRQISQTTYSGSS